MKSTHIALIGVIVAGLVGAGLASASLTTPLFLVSTQTSNMENSLVGMLGHITVIAYDADGNIKSYLQSDNQIVNIGENCVAEVLFNVASVSEPCAGTGGTDGKHGPNTGGFTFIAIGTNNAAVASNQAALSTEASESRLNATASAGVSMTDSTGTGASKAIVVIVDTFTMDAGKTIEEYGLFDASTSGNMFARQTPGGTILSASDTLQVTWTIDVGA